MPIPTASAVRSRSTRVLGLILALLLVGTLAVALFAGRLVYTEDPLAHADAIVVLAGTLLERALEASDLYVAGYAPVVVLSTGSLDGGQQTLARRGIPVPTDAELAKTALVRLGIPADAIAILPGPHDSTGDEARSIRALAAGRGWRTIIVVTSKFHTWRARWAIRHALAGTPARVIMRASRYDPADPARWWRRRGDVRSLMFELQKCVFYAVRPGG